MATDYAVSYTGGKYQIAAIAKSATDRLRTSKWHGKSGSVSAPMSILVLIAVTTLFWFELRILYREIKTGVPHLFFSPHPAFRNRPGNRKHPYLWLTVALRVFGTLVLALMVYVAVLFLLESLGLVY